MNSPKNQKKPKNRPARPGKPAQRTAPHQGKIPSTQEMQVLVDFFNMGRYAEVLTLAQAMTADFPQHAFGWRVLGTVLKQMGRGEDALAPMQKAVAFSPQDAVALSNLGITLQDLGRLEEAEASFRRALKVRPDYALAHNNLGAILNALGRREEAAASFRRALQITPDYAAAHSNLGVVFKDTGRLNEAAASFRRALQIMPDHAEAHSNLGVTLQSLNQPDEAEASFRRALQVRPDYAEAHSNLGNLLRDSGRLDEAETSYRRALQIKPDYVEAYNNLGGALKELKRLGEAEASFRHALQIRPDYAEALNNLGLTLKDLGKLDEAEASFRRALQIKPDYAEALCHLGNTLCELDDLTQAAVAYQKTLDIAPASQGWDAAVYLAILRYLDGDFAQCRSNLLASQAVMATTGPEHDNSRNYWKYLDKLLCRQQQWSPDDQAREMGALYVIGESHALSSHRVTVRYKEQEMRCEAEWITGCKQWHLGNDQANKYKHKFEAVMARLPRASTILLSIGEIDCRHDEGIIKAWKKYPDKTLAEVAQSTAASYLNYVAAIGRRHGHSLIVGGVPASNLPPNLPPNTLTASALGQLVNLIRDFNAALKSLSLAAGMDFLDVYALTDRGDGVAGGEWHIDNIHLLPDAVAEAFDRHCLQSEAR